MVVDTTTITSFSFSSLTLLSSLGFSETPTSGHEPGSKNLQNKQGTSGGVPTDSSMLKLGREIESVKMSVLQVYIFTYLFVSITSLFMKKDDDPLFMESG